MPDFSISTRRRNHDVECLKCGAFNIPDNRICGRCGANLPVVYDKEGQVFHWEDAQGYEALVHKPEVKGRRSVNKTRWLLRGLVLLIALLFAVYIMNHH